MGRIRFALERLKRGGATPTARNPRWQFEKTLADGRSIVVECHSPATPPLPANVIADGFRVKHKSSLGEDGIHGRQNPEAVGAEIQPFTMTIEDIVVDLPNSVTWSTMKLTAMRDRWEQTQDSDRPEEYRNFARVQALKHAQDVCRVVGLTTRTENDGMPEIVRQVAATKEFAIARDINTTFFQADEHPVLQAIASSWEPEDMQLIRTILKSWYA